MYNMMSERLCNNKEINSNQYTSWCPLSYFHRQYQLNFFMHTGNNWFINYHLYTWSQIFAATFRIYMKYNFGDEFSKIT